MIIKMMHGCDVFGCHPSRVAKRAIKIRNGEQPGDPGIAKGNRV
jgi:hypothetical protein